MQGVGDGQEGFVEGGGAGEESGLRYQYGDIGVFGEEETCRRGLGGHWSWIGWREERSAGGIGSWVEAKLTMPLLLSLLWYGR